MPPPAGLQCLARWYSLQPELHAGRWWGRLPDGTRLAWDDGRAKDEEQALAAPDLQDTLAQPYPLGPLEPPPAGANPGRVRAYPLLDATYGLPSALRTVQIRFLGQRLRVHPAVVEPLGRVERRLRVALALDPTLWTWLRPLGGGYVHRRIAGTTRLSVHSYGIAVDLAVAQADYWRWQRPRGAPRWRNRFPASVVAAFEAEGFVWGGRWERYDTPHFEYRPELFAPECRPVRAPRPDR